MLNAIHKLDQRFTEELKEEDRGDEINDEIKRKYYEPILESRRPKK